ncbi:MAG: peptidoglycan editing factor PgeF [Gammaproteobacteria bacterium]|nr:peptidoglycan editing factor PgeF [Gammaproteobacteria bacterium]
MTWITANFPDLPASTLKRLSAFTTTRMGGSSSGQFDSFNLATHVGDELDAVYSNRALLREKRQLPSEPYWLNQTHSNTVIEIPYQYRGYTDGNIIAIIEADASYTALPNHICTVMTADCLPLLLVDSKGTKVAAIHAGWRGLANGIIEKTINKMAVETGDLHVWLGPAIGPDSFEVGEEVKQQFVALSALNRDCFVEQPQSLATEPKKFLCDIYQLAKNKLNVLGVKHISGGEFDTVTELSLFYSYRRDGQTGRMASLIWLS